MEGVVGKRSLPIGVALLGPSPEQTWFVTVDGTVRDVLGERGAFDFIQLFGVGLVGCSTHPQIGCATPLVDLWAPEVHF